MTREYKQNLGKLSITKRYGSGDPIIIIEIKDDASGVVIAEVETSLNEFAEAITGLGSRPVNVVKYPTEEEVSRYNKVKMIKSVELDPPHSYDKSIMNSEVNIMLLDLQEVKSGEYRILDNGITRRQDGKKHIATLVKYADIDSEEAKKYINNC